MKRRWITTLAIGSAALGGYMCGFRPWSRRWGATDDELARAMPGDAEVSDPLLTMTNAVTIAARPEEIWPWLVQIGQGRGGFYSYEWIERLIGLDISNSDRILPEWQHLAAGDTIPFGKGTFVPIAALEANRTLLLVMHDAALVDVSWVFGLYPLDERRTRLVTRCRARMPRTTQTVLWLAAMDPGVFVMMRAMLLGIKRRAERHATGEIAADPTPAREEAPSFASVA